MNTDMSGIPDLSEFAHEDGTYWWLDALQIQLRCVGFSLISSPDLDTDTRMELIDSFGEQIAGNLNISDPIFFEVRDGLTVASAEESEVQARLANVGHKFLLNTLKYRAREDVFNDSELFSLARKDSPKFYERLMEFQLRDELTESFSHAGQIAILTSAIINDSFEWSPPDVSGTELNVMPKPASQPYGVSHEGAETLVRDWMLYLGIQSAEVTRLSGDGGIDVTSHSHVAQVKNYKDVVGAPAIREILGVAVSEGKKPLFFTSGSYTSEALNFAQKAEIPLFTYDAVNGTLECANDAAQSVYEARNNVNEQEVLAVAKEKLWLFRQSAWILYGATNTSSRLLNWIFPGKEEEVLEIKRQIDTHCLTIQETRDLWTDDDQLESIEEVMDRLASARESTRALAEANNQIMTLAGVHED